MTTFSGDASVRLAEFDDPPAEPFGLLREWFDTAVWRGISEPYAMVLATADAAGFPSSRVVLLKSFDGDGLVFTSHTGSRKGSDLAARGYASATFHWRETVQQVHVSGPVRRLGAAQSDALFAERPVMAQATTAVSSQSSPLDDEEVLRERATQLLNSGRPIPRPDAWAGYRLEPTGVEFWQGREDRLHRRLHYNRVGRRWTASRLQP
jgi:dihydrophenazinedicarboxylate synthase